MRIAALLCMSVAMLSITTAMANTTHAAMLPTLVNISFVKEVTLSLQPLDLAELTSELSQEDHEQVEDFLTSSLRLLDPIMRFFEGMVSFGNTPAHEA